MSWNPKFPKKKRLNRSAEEDTFWRWFSRYIRLRDTSDTGICRCITCNTMLHPMYMQCGHFIKRNRYSIKYNEENNNAQCPGCNSFENGNAGVYAIRLDQKYGAGTAEKLVNLASRKGKLKAFECKLLADEYREKAYAELKRTGLEKWWK